MGTNNKRTAKIANAAGRAVMNAFVEAAASLAGNRRDGNADTNNPGAAFFWGQDVPKDRVECFTSLALECGHAAIALQFGQTQLKQGPTQVVVVVADTPGHKMTYPHCVFWMAEGDDTLLIVPQYMFQEHGHFALRGGRLEHRAGWPVEDLQPGIERAAELLRDMVSRRRAADGIYGTSMHEVRLTA